MNEYLRNKLDEASREELLEVIKYANLKLDVQTDLLIGVVMDKDSETGMYPVLKLKGGAVTITDYNSFKTMLENGDVVLDSYNAEKGILLSAESKDGKIKWKGLTAAVEKLGLVLYKKFEEVSFKDMLALYASYKAIRYKYDKVGA